MSALLNVTDLRLQRGEREILRGVSFEVMRGEVVALMGLSGGGKTTVLRCIAALEKFNSGKIEIDGFTLNASSSRRESDLRALRERVALVFQQHALFEHLSVLDNVSIAPVHVAKKSVDAARARAVELLASLGVEHRAAAVPRALSGGEAQRVAIARALAMDPSLLLMDEPTASLDPARRNDLGGILTDLSAGGRTLVISTHDADFVRAFATRVVILASGEVVESGIPDDVLDNPSHPATKMLLEVEKRTP
jgi:ABC-type polar amino acid transport system ATPase subunit